MSSPDPSASGKPSGKPSGAGKPTRLRYAQTAVVVLIILTVCAVPFAYGVGWWGLLVFVPIILAWVLLRRVGADIAADEVVIRGPFYTRRVPRTDIAGLVVEGERRVALLRTDGSSIVIPTARPRDLSRLRELLFADASADSDEPSTDADARMDPGRAPR